MNPYSAVGITAKTSLWHGGAPGIAVGDYIVAASECRRRGISWGVRNHDYDDSVVYISPDKEFARAFACRVESFRGRGVLYRVEPTPPSSLAPDVDFPAAVGLSCKRARVVAVEEVDIAMPESDALSFFGRYMTWDDGRAVYDSEGYMSPAANWVGADAMQVRSLGVWNAVPDVGFDPRTKRAFLINPTQ